MKNTKSSMLKEVERALSLMPTVSKSTEAAYFDGLRYSKKLFAETIKEISKFRLSK